MSRLLIFTHGVAAERLRATLAAVCLLTLLLATTSCRRSDNTGDKSAGGNSNASNAAGETSATPPFPTKEPERYRATQIETISDGTQSVNVQLFIARDGERRRVDEVTPGGVRISRLELPGGIYYLAPEQKIYTELEPVADGAGANVSQDFSPEKLLNETRPEALYEKLGAETVNGRATVKYRVTVRRKAGSEKEVTAESLIWVDESLGMPIKSETTSTRETANGVSSNDRVTMELRDINESVDAGLFELPPDYTKVGSEAFFKQLNQADSAGKGR